MTLFDIIVIGFASYAFVNYFHYDATRADSKPFMSVNKVVGYVTDDYQTIYHPVSAMDYVRRVFGMYIILKNENEQEQKVWMVNRLRSSVWECPMCLSFWAGALFTIMFIFTPIFVYIFSAGGVVHTLLMFQFLSEGPLVSVYSDNFEFPDDDELDTDEVN